MMTKAVFLDRDGVINAYPGDGLYVTRWQDFQFLPGAIDAIKALNAAGYRIFVVSNQAGISRGIYPQSALDEITRNMLDRVRRAGARIDEVYYCIHTRDHNCSCRKPKTGNIDHAKKLLHNEGLTLDNRESYFVGDTESDIETGKAAGLRTILVYSGKIKPGDEKSWPISPDHAADDLLAATHIILNNPS